MDSDSMATADKKIHEQNNGSNQEIIVVDGRGYQNNVNNKREIYTLVDVIEDSQTANNLNEEIVKRAAEIIERITRELVPEIAEKVIREEIEKLKKLNSNE